MYSLMNAHAASYRAKTKRVRFEAVAVLLGFVTVELAVIIAMLAT